MKTKIDYIVCICLMFALYINLTDFPKQRQVVHGQLIKIGIEQ